MKALLIALAIGTIALTSCTPAQREEANLFAHEAAKNARTGWRLNKQNNQKPKPQELPMDTIVATDTIKSIVIDSIN